MRFRLFFAGLMVLALVPAGAFAQQAPAPDAKGEWIHPPQTVPSPKTRKGKAEDPTHNLDFLFEALKIAPDDTSAKAIEQRIWMLWMISPSDTANLLMGRVRRAVEAKDTALAIKLLDAIVAIRPDYVEAWNRRATIHFMRKDYGASLQDLMQVLKLEPRHFGALSGLGLILQEIGDDKRALDVYRRLIAVHPHMQRIQDQLKTLQTKVEGRDI
jgi:tetratricopeptide (TPR) repeat protein